MFDIIIPAAGCGQRMGAKSPKGLISLGSETVLQRQIRLLKLRYDANIIVVGGHKHSKLFKSLPNDTMMVLNNDYANNNVALSINRGIEFTKPDRPALVVYGDLVFNMNALSGVWPTKSAVVVEESNAREAEVGVSSNDDGNAIQFAFGLPAKWAHIVMLMPEEKKLFVEACKPQHHFRYFGYEILNHIIASGGSFQVLRTAGMKLVEIDSVKDIPEAVELANENPL